MGRLTKRENGKLLYRISPSSAWRVVDKCIVGYEAIKKLAHYEDMEEQGRLIELPCALYDRAWGIMPFNKIRSESVGSFGYSEGGLELWDWNGEWLGIFGKTAFLTEEEAEAKLRELDTHERE